MTCSVPPCEVVAAVIVFVTSIFVFRLHFGHSEYWLVHDRYGTRSTSPQVSQTQTSQSMLFTRSSAFAPWSRCSSSFCSSSRRMVWPFVHFRGRRRRHRPKPKIPPI